MLKEKPSLQVVINLFYILIFTKINVLKKIWMKFSIVVKPIQ